MRHLLLLSHAGDFDARITAIDQDGHAFQDDGCEFLLVFDDGNFSEEETFLLGDWLAHTPKDVLAKNFGVPESAFDRIPQKDLWIFQAPVPDPTRRRF